MAKTLTLRIGKHAFEVQAQDDQEEERLLAAARRVGQLFTEYGKGKQIADGERVALMVALDMASGQDVVDADVITRLDETLDEALAIGQATGTTG